MGSVGFAPRVLERRKRIKGRRRLQGGDVVGVEGQMAQDFGGLQPRRLSQNGMTEGQQLEFTSEEEPRM